MTKLRFTKALPRSTLAHGAQSPTDFATAAFRADVESYDTTQGGPLRNFVSTKEGMVLMLQVEHFSRIVVGQYDSSDEDEVEQHMPFASQSIEQLQHRIRLALDTDDYATAANLKEQIKTLQQTRLTEGYHSLPEPEMNGSADDSETDGNLQLVMQTLAEHAQPMGAGTDLMESGVTSMQGVAFIKALQARTGVTLPPGLLFEYPTSRLIAEYLDQQSAPVGAIGAGDGRGVQQKHGLLNESNPLQHTQNPSSVQRGVKPSVHAGKGSTAAELKSAPPPPHPRSSHIHQLGSSHTKQESAQYPVRVVTGEPDKSADGRVTFGRVSGLEPATTPKQQASVGSIQAACGTRKQSTKECLMWRKRCPAVVLSLLMGCAAVVLFMTVVISIATEVERFCRISTISSCVVNLVFNLFWFRCTRKSEGPDEATLWGLINVATGVASAVMLVLAIVDSPFVCIQIGGAILAGASLAFIIRWLCEDSVARDCLSLDTMDLEAQTVADPTMRNPSVPMQALMHPDPKA